MRHLPDKSRIGPAFLTALILSLPIFLRDAGVRAEDARPISNMPLAPVRAPTNLHPEKVALGAKLFGDPMLSGKGALSCNSCHDLSKGGTVGWRRTVGYEGKRHRFNAPTIFNAAGNYRLGWRGDFTSLEEQNEKVLLDENLMGISWETLLDRLRANQQYQVLFRATYGRGADRKNVLDALANFQKSLVTTNAPFDRFLAGEDAAISHEARTGYLLFREYGCASCHQGSNIGGNMFQQFGVFAEPALEPDMRDDSDLGRWTVTGAEEDKGVFRVPSLRNVEMTAPYFHDGRAATLPEAVELMSRSQLGAELAPQDVQAIVAFLSSLTGEYDGRRLSATPLESDP